MVRERRFALFVIAVVSMLLPGAAFAAGPTQHFGPFDVVTQDNGSCNVRWADLTIDRYWTVRDNGDGTFAVTRQDRNGTFVTLGGISPGACSNTNTPHGSIVRAGITGTFQGYVTFTVTSDAFNAGGCNADGNPCTTTSGFMSAVFPGGRYSGETWSFQYAAAGQGLGYHAWKDASDATLGEVFLGDIADR
jgi:hypothetical protein